jgi:endoglucanase
VILICAAVWAGSATAQEPAERPAAPPIRLNTLGYLPDAAKRASVAAPCEAFAVVRVEDGARVLEGTIEKPVRNEDTGEELWVVDFSRLRSPGEYVLEVAGVGRSAPFQIAGDLYRQPYSLVTRGMYLWRCGCSVHGEHNRQTYEHAACHLHDGGLDFVGSKGERKVGVGGWHDAGDFNKYVVNAGVTVGCMFRAWDDFQPQIEAVELDIPESGGELPDFLAELKYEIDWLFSMQAPDGSIYHKLSAQHFCGFIMPEDEHDPRYFSPWSSAATADFVAMMAAASRHFRPYDPAYADRCLAAARKSYEFLQAHPEDHQPDQSAFNTGGYGAPDWDDRLWAAAELWEATGDKAMLANFEARARAAEPQRRRWWRSRNEDDEDDEGNRPTIYQWRVAADWDWGNVKNLGLLTYLFSERPGRDPELVNQIRESLLETADRIVETAKEHGYARPLGERYYWGCNGTVARQVVVLEAARRVVRGSPDPAPGGSVGRPATTEEEYRATSLDALNHLFGRNVHGRSYVTGLGDRPPLKPHDRRSAADENVDPWPGYLVGGPHPNAVDWNDDETDYRTNEIAINWNGALIYALAAFLEDGESGAAR